MTSVDYDVQPARASVLAASWQATLVLGVLSVILGIIVSFYPTGSLNVLAVLFGIQMILFGIFHLLRIFDRDEQHRIWVGIAGLLSVVIGVVLIRHLHVTVQLIGLIIGLSWIVQGLAAVIGGLGHGLREGNGWWIAFGVVSFIAGIVVVAAPVTSLKVMAVLLGIWFIILGLFEIVAGFLLRQASRAAQATST
jgi:uncharacterized membrane protein HdeD (DUF308 family)